MKKKIIRFLKWEVKSKRINIENSKYKKKITFEKYQHHFLNFKYQYSDRVNRKKYASLTFQNIKNKSRNIEIDKLNLIHH